MVSVSSVISVYKWALNFFSLTKTFYQNWSVPITCKKTGPKLFTTTLNSSWKNMFCKTVLDICIIQYLRINYLLIDHIFVSKLCPVARVSGRIKFLTSSQESRKFFIAVYTVYTQMHGHCSFYEPIIFCTIGIYLQAKWKQLGVYTGCIKR